MIKRRSVLAATAGWTIVGASAVRAQAWPAQQIKIVVPYGPGGATDTAGRLLAEKLTPLVGQQVIVENKGGGNTIIGMELVAKSKPDGYTLLLGTTTLATNAALGLKQPYDPLKDFQPISTLADIPDFIAINKDLPVKDYKAFVDWVNSQPQKVRYATSGLGNQPHLWAELFRARNKLNLENIAYKNAADALRDVMGGHVPIVIDVVMPAGVLATQGKLTGIAVSSEKRSPVCPDVPTVVELGMPDMVSAVFFGVVGPAGIPRPVLDRLNGLVRQIIKEPAVEKKFADLGYVTTGSTPEAYLEKLKFETERWTKVVKDNGIKVEG
ncbi:MAG: tripartite tricarboxylate transporter substrate binding protein [Reyranella sp.]|uniref:Bug family tripartite tricarboxylate transporter substrate binding protein n=1 Tax=Reyranella sp. TaxID=1929291 RepID=UPI002731FDAB|nr:tripartite tricarboxylate transporter substrate binding protein [Reyranella sp.]MDP1961240.1 tripartite tricarboxylate transporter substrate binding protein [Reyranella sp.]MDP2372958.1 tripartite tricarboxylate transporter substrate binding protein [Reyranella sp.]